MSDRIYGWPPRNADDIRPDDPMHHLREAFRDRVAKLVADGRAVKSADGVELLNDLPDLVEKQAEAIIAAAADNVDAIVARVVPKDLRTAVLWRLFERGDLIPWPRPWAFDQRYRWEGADFADDVEVDRYLTLLHAERPGEAEKLIWCMWLWRLQCTIDVVDANYDPRWRDRDRDAWLRSEVAGGWPGGERVGEFGYRIDGLIPPQKAPTVDRIVAACGPCDIQTARLVAWFFVGETRPERLAETAAFAVLAEDTKKGHDLPTHPDAGLDLSRQVRRAIPGAPVASDDVEVIDGVQPLDEALAAMVEGFGQTGRKLAGVIRDTKKKTPEERAARWRPLVDPLRVPRILARALWDDVVAPRLQRQASRTDAPGMSMTALTSLMGMSRRGAQKELFHDAAVILDDKRRRVGSLRTVVEVDARHVNLADLNRLTTQRLIRWALHRGWDQKWVCDSPDPTRIVVDGGYPALALELGMKGKKAADELKGAVATLQSVFLQGPKGEGQVFAAWHHKASGQRRARLEMTLLGPFAPDYIARELAEHRNVNDKSVVPVPLPAHLPPLVGRERDYGSQAILQLLALRELRLRATELAADGAVDISARRWEDLRDEAGVPRATLADVLEAYPIGDGIRPAFMLQRDGRWDLAPDYSQERAAIVAAGEAIQKGKRGGEQAAANRRAGRAKPKTTRRAAK